MSGFNREEKLPESHSVPTFEKKIRHEYLDKNADEFYFVLVPEVEGYEPDTTSYHIEAANVKVKGSDKIWDVRGNCLGKACRRCELNRSIFKKDMDTPFKKKSQLGRIFMAYRVYPNAADKTFRFGSKAEPLLTEYWYVWDKDAKKMVCQDWVNLMDAFEKATAEGLDPLDPNKAVVFRAVRRKGSDDPLKPHNRTHYYHSHISGQSVKLPETWAADLKKRYKFDDICLKFGVEDMRVLVDTSEEVLRLDADLDSIEGQIKDLERKNPQASRTDAISQEIATLNAAMQETVKNINKVYENYKTIGNNDFRNILEGMEKKSSTYNNSKTQSSPTQTDGKGFGSGNKSLAKETKAPASEMLSNYVPNERDFASSRKSEEMPSFVDILDDITFGNIDAIETVKSEPVKAKVAPAPAPVAPKVEVPASGTSVNALKNIQESIRLKQEAAKKNKA